MQYIISIFLHKTHDDLLCTVHKYLRYVNQSRSDAKPKRKDGENAVFSLLNVFNV